MGAASKPDSKDHKIRTDPAYVKQACQRSLDRLGVDTIDLYYVHRVDFQTPIEHTVQAMVELKACSLSFPFHHRFFQGSQS